MPRGFPRERAGFFAHASAAAGLSSGSPAPAGSTAILRRRFDLDAVAWRETSWPGVRIHFLRSDRASGYAAVLIQMEPGSRYPGHLHTGPEELLVLEGAYADENGRYEAGSFVRYEAGTSHRPYCPDDGARCSFFAIAREGIELFGDESAS